MYLAQLAHTQNATYFGPSPSIPVHIPRNCNPSNRNFVGRKLKIAKIKRFLVVGVVWGRSGHGHVVNTRRSLHPKMCSMCPRYLFRHTHTQSGNEWRTMSIWPPSRGCTNNIKVIHGRCCCWHKRTHTHTFATNSESGSCLSLVRYLLICGSSICALPCNARNANGEHGISILIFSLCSPLSSFDFRSE